MTDFCNCETWKYYIKNYNETFYWNKISKSWCIQWVNLSTKEGVTQVSRYAIPITCCPLCGGQLKNPIKDRENVK